MNLSNRLTFSLVFSVLLVTTLAFIVSPAIAQQVVTVTVTGAYTPDDNTTSDFDEELLVLTFTFSHNQSLTLADFFTTYQDDNGDGLNEFSGSLLEDPPADPVIWVVGGSGKVFTLSSTTDNANADDPAALYLKGYITIIDADTVNHDEDANTPEVVRFANPGGGEVLESLNLLVAPGYIGGYSYAIIGNHILEDTDNNVDTPDVYTYPTMPSNVTDHMRSNWSVHTDQTVPDLWDHFQVNGAGTLNLIHTSDGTTQVGGNNTRTVRINEVMWARDESQVGQPGHTREQWIEIYNSTYAPILLSNIRLLFSKTHPSLGVYTDRLTNNPSYTDIWGFSGIGQDGNSNPNRLKEFRSMHRTRTNTDGSSSAAWASAATLFLPNFKGTPGEMNSVGGTQLPRSSPGKDWPAKSPVIFNEIFNSSTAGMDWVELRNVTDSTVSLNKWALTISKGRDNEEDIIRFPNKSIPANGILLLVESDPSGTPIGPGWDVSKTEYDQVFGVNQTTSPNYMIVTGLNKIPNDSENWLLLLRKPNSNGHPYWDVNGGTGGQLSTLKTGFDISDAAGPGGPGGDFNWRTLQLPAIAREKTSTGGSNGEIWETKLFPLNGHTESNGDFLQSDRLTRNNVFQRNSGKHGFQKDAWTNNNFTGIGYDRSATRDNDARGGTPGYPNDAVVSSGNNAIKNVVISEVMIAQIELGRNYTPQWIEITNTSSTIGVDLHNFRLTIINHDKTYDQDGTATAFWDGKGEASILLQNLTLPPRQTVLIASAATRQSSVKVPAERILTLYHDGHKNTFGMVNPGDPVINPYGFHIMLHTKGNEAVDQRELVDEIGNLAEAEDRRGNRQRFDDPRWEIPNGVDENKTRSSLVRKNIVTGDPTTMTFTRAIGDGKAAEGWILARLDQRTDLTITGYTSLSGITSLYYGSRTDISTPGQTPGQPLPVSLSSFRPALENGKVVIRWITESELDNAGFNILRSDSRNGEYKQINTELIRGAGTTGERNTYKWVDGSAKHNVVYYYQIEDVSFAGERQTLTTTKLKGLISAKNKLTTRWGELKSKN